MEANMPHEVNPLALVLESLAGGINSFLDTRTQLDQIRAQREQQQFEQGVARQQLGMQPEQLGLEKKKTEFEMQRTRDIDEASAQVRAAEDAVRTANARGDVAEMRAAQNDLDNARQLLDAHRQMYEMSVEFGASGEGKLDPRQRLAAAETLDASIDQIIDAMLAENPDPSFQAAARQQGLQAKFFGRNLIATGQDPALVIETMRQYGILPTPGSVGKAVQEPPKSQSVIGRLDFQAPLRKFAEENAPFPVQVLRGVEALTKKRPPAKPSPSGVSSLTGESEAEREYRKLKEESVRKQAAMKQGGSPR